jgi:hypothetical protein
MRIILLLLIVLLSPVSYAADSNDIMVKEIEHLFDHMKNSGCRFNRNGKWYNAEEAMKHIHNKYNYLVKRGRINSTEQFIERAASKSSMSGKPYKIKCGEGEPVKSSVWFKRELMNFREKEHE